MKKRGLTVAAAVGLGVFAWAAWPTGSQRTDVSALPTNVQKVSGTYIAPETTRPPAYTAPIARQETIASEPRHPLLPEARGAADATEVMATLSPLRRPIIEAIRQGGLTPEQKRTTMLRAIEDSGVSREPWTAVAQTSFDAWGAAMPNQARQGLRLGRVSCFRAGCIVEVAFFSEAAYQEAAAAFRTISEAGSAHGGRVQTPPDPTSGKIIANWIMLRPEEPADDDDA